MDFDSSIQELSGALTVLSSMVVTYRVACNSVDEVQLASVTSLDLSRNGLTSLQIGDFDDLAGLRTLDGCQ